MADWYQLSKIMGVVVLAAMVLVLFGYWMGRKTITGKPMIERAPQPFDPGPTDPEEMSLLDDAAYTENDYGGDK